MHALQAVNWLMVHGAWFMVHGQKREHDLGAGPNPGAAGECVGWGVTSRRPGAAPRPKFHEPSNANSTIHHLTDSLI